MTIRATGNNSTLQLEGPDTYTSGCVLQTRLHCIPAGQAVPKFGDAEKPARRKSANQYMQKDMTAHKSGMVELWYKINKYEKIYKS